MTLGNEGQLSPAEEIDDVKNNEMKTLTGASDSFAGNHYYT